MDINNKYNVDGVMMDMSEIVGDVFDNWELCREKLYYMYGINFSDGIGNNEGGRHSVAMLALYAMNDLELTASETDDLEAARHEQKIRSMERKEGMKKSNRIA